MQEILLFFARWTVNIILGGFMGMPIFLFEAIRAAIWAKSQDFPTKPKPLPKSIARRFLETETGLTMEYLSSTKETDKIAVFLHGFPDSPTSWIPLMLKFQNEGFQTFAPTQRGYGQTRSNKTDEIEDYALDCLRDDAASFIENINSGKKVTLVIHDWGSVVGFHLARTRPELVERVIGINSVSLPAYNETALTNVRQTLASFYIYVFQFPIFPELMWKMNDFALLKAICCQMAQRGYGQTRSDKTDEVDDFALDCLRDDVASFIENINSGRKVTLVIHDWGSLVGFHLARTRPDLVERIIAFNSVSLPAYIETALSNRKQTFASYYVYFF
ncbi:Oidioi.mRNA.OKI2018_I69.chr1.g2534.t2.cds [Oikopleura dioica]|uniref:Oidioi.mRNA.OKI2018_I69.chr1.g2534.t2.cds n=1 Tax=Oikopleura dioica TaxID=34765 RepID=A0ABN7SYA8_OIKDI|nr:Oidioi.mRNA.OKI2018_I69.chr1.g2534.t2.cds [Oikopleura dioica]